MNFNLKLWSLSLLLLIVSVAFETKILAGDRTVSIEDSCRIGKDGQEIEAFRKIIHRVTMPLNGSSTHDHLTFFHDGASKDCTACIEIDHPELTPIDSSYLKPSLVAVKPQASTSFAVATTVKPNSKDLATKDRDLLADNRRKQMFEYNLGRLHEAESIKGFYLGAAIACGGIILIEAAKFARSR